MLQKGKVQLQASFLVRRQVLFIKGVGLQGRSTLVTARPIVVFSCV